MKNVSYSTILFSAFSQDGFLSPVKNKIKPITSSVKKIIKKNNENNKKRFINSALSMTNIRKYKNKYNILQKRIYNPYNPYIINNNDTFENMNNIKPKVLDSFYSPKSVKRKKKFKNKFKFTKDFIKIKTQRALTPNPSFKKILYKAQKYYVEPYKKYLNEKTKIELNRKAKEREMNYIIESKRQQQIQLENNIRNKFQGLDFSRQKKREFFLAKYLKSKQYGKKKEKSKNSEDDNDIFKQSNYQYLMKRLNFEINEKKYLFLDNNEFVPRVRYSSFNEKYRTFMWNLRDNPNFNALINYISKK